MKSLVRKGISTIQNDGLKVFAMRMGHYGMVKLKRMSRGKDADNLKRWADLKDIHKGKRVFIIGNAPSLNKMPLYFLKDEYTMGFNRFNLMFERLNWLPSFYMVTDDLVIKDMHQQINEEILPKVPYAFFPDIHPSNVEFDKYIDHRENVYWLNTDRPEFRADLPKCGINKTVVNAAIQVAAYLGFSDIYLIGVDMSFADQKVKKMNSRNWEADEHDPNHFDPRYFGKGRKYHNPTVHEMIEKFEMGREFYTPRGVRIHNAGVGGKLEVFPRVDFTSLFNFDDNTKIDLLTAVSGLQDMGITFNEVLEKATHHTTGDKYPEMFCVDGEAGITLISKLIETYLPVGEYNGKYYFVKKK
ncbi:DUF115 domain-containing protein [Mucilaginibacter sp. JRF]|uniref:6-hydroxymethylpterin diphosphokinase MptE-like protein n=1 Tax=Mucilaginibacter sp. JRF TaxID=2780088 RepID=UPI0018803BE6|nr:6-hydroxymethylpterin diphosphokinase MptE-like protein [Mucilaginibacter sp. JRF]MBE9585350.1 DUF115 domain-containing protein [Mucilaginibacter sp. JRF]